MTSNFDFMDSPDKVVISGDMGPYTFKNLLLVNDAFSKPVMEPLLVNTSAEMTVYRQTRQFSPENIVIVSNGMCGSMCSYTTAW